MKDTLSQILNPYISVSEKDILWEMMELEENNELSTNKQLWTVSDSAAIFGQVGTIAESISTVNELSATATN